MQAEIVADEPGKFVAVTSLGLEVRVTTPLPDVVVMGVFYGGELLRMWDEPDGEG